jgi:hypothetical protein
VGNLLLAAAESSESSAGNADLTEAQGLLKQMAHDSVTSPNTRRSYALTLDELFAFSAGRPLTRALLPNRRSRYRPCCPSEPRQQTHLHRPHDPINRWLAGKLLRSLSGKLFQLSIARSDGHSRSLKSKALNCLQHAIRNNARLPPWSALSLRASDERPSLRYRSTQRWAVRRVIPASEATEARVRVPPRQGSMTRYRSIAG